MKEWLAGLKPRERQIVIGGAGVAFVLLLYLVLWAPFSNGVERLERSVAEQKSLALWLTQAGHEIQLLRGAGGAAAHPDGRSPLAVVDQSARAAGLGAAIRRIEPEGENTVHITLEQAPFDDVVGWLGSLAQQSGLRVDNLTVDKTETPGAVNARLTLKRG